MQCIDKSWIKFSPTFNINNKTNENNKRIETTQLKKKLKQITINSWKYVLLGKN